MDFSRIFSGFLKRKSVGLSAFVWILRICSDFLDFFRIFFRDFFRCPPFLTWQRTFTNKLHQVLHIFLVDLRIFEGFLWICEGFLWIFEGFVWFFKDFLDFDGFQRILRISWIFLDFFRIFS